MIPATPDTLANLHVYRAQDRAVERRPGFVSHQSFNFGHHHRPGRDGFGALRVFNDDAVEHGVGIPLHPHAHVEILSVLLEGEMSHEDNLGNTVLVRSSEVKHMSAGTGLYHGGTCYHGTRFLQIWITPEVQGTPPEVRKQAFATAERQGSWQLQASPYGEDGGLPIKQQLYAYRGSFAKGSPIRYTQHRRARVFLMPLSGSLDVCNTTVATRDSAEFSTTEGLVAQALQETDVWLMVQP